GAKQIIYLDPDIQLYDSLNTAFHALETHNIALTPHLLFPLDDGAYPDENDLRAAGIYNLGFIGVSGTDETWRFLRWWAHRTYSGCVIDPALGLFVDQRWIDAVPALFEGVWLIRDRSYNVAYWNLPNRMEVALPMLMHFSGFEADNIEHVSRHQSRLRLDDLSPGFRRRFVEYRAVLLKSGYREMNEISYSYATLDDGTTITPTMRAFLRYIDPHGHRFHNPFRTDGKDTFRAAMAAPIGGGPLNALMAFYREQYPEIRGQFSDDAAYAAWFREHVVDL
ncbi:MAG: hypothetical protein AAF125_27110, partial [Chloroflexota bacterium]